MLPVTGTTHLLKLFRDDVMMLFLDAPCTFNELLTSEVLTSETFFLKLSLNDVLRSDSCMVRSWNPESRTTVHPLITYDYILKTVVEGMSHMEDTRYIRWRHYYGEMLLVGRNRSELTILLPL